MSRKPKFTAKQWRWTYAHESLFDLDQEDLLTYTALINAATADNNGTT